jgi:hypothetical protein
MNPFFLIAHGRSVGCTARVIVVLVFAFVLTDRCEAAKARIVAVGDSRSAVVETLGEPTGTAVMGDTEILYYPHSEIELRAGKVIRRSSIKPAKPPSPPRAAELSPPTEESRAFWLLFRTNIEAGSTDLRPKAFGEFLNAFQMTAFLTTTGRKEADPPSQFIKDIEQVAKVGYLKEYVYTNYRMPNWFTEPELRSAEYAQWMEKNLPDHRPSGLPRIPIKREDRTDDKSNVPALILDTNLVPNVSGLVFRESKRFRDPSDGVELKYVGALDDDVVVDFYVYPNIYPKDTRNPLVDEMSVVKLGLLYLYYTGKFSKFEEISESFQAPHESIAKGVYEIKMEGNPMTTTAYLTHSQDLYIKARSTGPGRIEELLDKDIRLVMTSVLQAIKPSH